MSPATQIVLRRGTVLVMVPVILAVVLSAFWRDVPWTRDIILALGFVTAAFVSFVFTAYRMTQGREIGYVQAYLPFGLIGLALVAIVASIENALGR